MKENCILQPQACHIFTESLWERELVAAIAEAENGTYTTKDRSSVEPHVGNQSSFLL